MLSALHSTRLWNAYFSWCFIYLKGLLEMNHLSPCCIHKPDLSSALLFNQISPWAQFQNTQNWAYSTKKRAFHSHSIYSWFMWYEENCRLFCLVWKWVPHQAWKSSFLLPLFPSVLCCTKTKKDGQKWRKEPFCIPSNKVEKCVYLPSSQQHLHWAIQHVHPTFIKILLGVLYILEHSVAQ